MTDKRQRRFSLLGFELGQGLVEFSLILPALLLTLMGIADFGRMVAVYSNLYNAAREGARFGVVNPKDVPGITAAARAKINLVDANQVNVWVHYDSGPGTALKSFDAVTVGDRVLVTLETDVDMITPLVRLIAQQLHVDTVGTRTIATLGNVGTGDALPAPPTYTPSPTSPPTPTNTVDPFAPTPTPIPIEIDIPLWEGDTWVTGRAQPGARISLVDLQDPTQKGKVDVNPDGTFEFTLEPLIGGHLIEVSGYGSVDYAVVQLIPQPTDTPTPTATPTPTPIPTTQYIEIAPACGPAVTTTITVSGYQWPIDVGNMAILWDGTPVVPSSLPSAPQFTTQITVTASVGMHDVEVVGVNALSQTYGALQQYEVPCPVTRPNLVVENIVLENQGVLTGTLPLTFTASTYDPLTFTVAVRNLGTAANDLFFVDLYVDPATEPPTASDLISETGVAWTAASSLLQNEAISLTLLYREGVDTTGGHNVYALADSWEHVRESDEQDNVGGPLTVTVDLNGTSPLPTPTPAPSGSGTGTISGATYLLQNNTVRLQPRVNLYLYAGTTLVAATLSDRAGDFLLTNIPAGSYTLVGEIVIDDVLHSDVVLSVPVDDATTTYDITLVLRP